jgi:histidine triad (HIT) family protein
MTDCIFCRIARGEIPARIAAKDDKAIAFHDLNPQAPTHVLVIPVQHVGGANEVGSEGAAIWTAVMGLATRVARELGVAETGYRLVVNQGSHGGQSVDHLHVHVLGGRRMGWPPG